ncbi:MAG: hypothetical protein QOC60_1580, partial [Frankiaceae bacterium]|nr:hypothetical protein [Frankiaceae bacterium]
LAMAGAPAGAPQPHASRGAAPVVRARKGSVSAGAYEKTAADYHRFPGPAPA